MDLECRTAARGCVDCKKHLIGNLNAALEPFRAEAGRAARAPDRTWCATCFMPATQRRATVAEETMEKVRAAVGLSPEP